MSDEYLTLQEAAADVRVNSWTIWRLARERIIPSIRVGVKPGTGHYRIRRVDWEAYKRSRAVKPLPLILVASGDGTHLIDLVFARSRGVNRRAAKTEGQKGG